jgi:hypothetical protein
MPTVCYWLLSNKQQEVSQALSTPNQDESVSGRLSRSILINGLRFAFAYKNLRGMIFPWSISLGGY